MLDFKKQFVDFVIQQKILQFGEFTLKSGRKSPYFFNAGLFNTGSRLAFLGRSYAAAIRQSGIEFDVLFGPAYKGIPLVSVSAMALAEQQGIDKPWCFNRKEAKNHGEGGMIVGATLAGRVLLIDDVITAGTAINEAVRIIKAAGAQLVGVVVAVDRQEKGSGALSTIQELEQTHRIKVVSIINLKDILDYLLAANDSNLGSYVQAISDYRHQYGVE
ncbi:MAG: orotate phosphoribosyltransferase [Pseudohongiellaceae bacterium]